MPASATTEEPERPRDGDAEDGQQSSGQESAASKRGRARLRRFRKSAILFGLGIAAGLVVFYAVYPQPETQIPVPASPSLVISTSLPVYHVSYAVTRAPHGRSVLTIIVNAHPINAASTPSAEPSVTVVLPPGTTFYGCSYACNPGGGRASTWTKALAFQLSNGTASFSVNASNFGIVDNGVYAYAAIPDVTIDVASPGEGLAVPTLQAAYRFASAGSYDWSGGPVPVLTGSTASWDEILAPGNTSGRTAAGTSHSRQKHDANFTFFAGALIGLAGGAFVAGVQELLPSAD